MGQWGLRFSPRQGPTPPIFPRLQPLTLGSMDDLYGNAWGDPLNDSSSQTYPLPAWNAQPSSLKQLSPVGDQGNNHANDDENEDPSTETQCRADTSDSSWTVDALPWPVEESHDPYRSAWVPVSPVDVWSSTAQQQTPIVPSPTPPGDVSPKIPPFASPTPSEEPKGEHLVSSEQAQDTPIKSRASSPDQFGTFESGNTDATIPVGEVGWGPPEHSTFGDSVDSSNAWGQQATAEERDTEAKPVDEWEAARRAKEKLEKRVVCEDSNPFDWCDSLSVCLSLRKSLQASLKPLKISLRRCGQKAHRVVQILKRSGFRAGDAVWITLKACT